MVIAVVMGKYPDILGAGVSANADFVRTEHPVPIIFKMAAS